MNESQASIKSKANVLSIKKTNVRNGQKVVS